MLGLLVYSCFSYSSETVYGTTGNAAQFGLNWVMTQVLPQQAGLQVNSVIYQYTTVKNQQDAMLVHVQNENARGPGYIFRETDDWSGLQGNTINKTVPVDLIDISYWGPGSIEVEGDGSVVDATVNYGFQYDPCFDPQTNPECPGYIDPFQVELNEAQVVDPLDDDYVQDELDRKANRKAQEEDEKDKERAKIRKEQSELADERLEVLLGIIDTNMMQEMAVIRHSQLQALNKLPMRYYEAISGGEYPESMVLKDRTLPDSKRGLRVNMAQELRHAEMVNLQYAK